MLDRNRITAEALNDLELLDTVLMNKKIYFASANYETAKIGTICLLPNDQAKELIRKDHAKMSDMFFGELPDFDEIMSLVAKLEKTINSCQK